MMSVQIGHNLGLFLSREETQANKTDPYTMDIAIHRRCYQIALRFRPVRTGG